MMNEARQDDKVDEETLSGTDGFAWEVIDALGEGVTIVGADGRFEYVNPAYAQMVGRSPQTLIGQTPFDVTHPDDHGQLQQSLKERLSGKRSKYETRLLRPDGTITYAYISGSPRWRGDEVIGMFATITDLTERRQAAQALKTQQQLIQKIFNANPNILYVYDLEAQQIVFQNRNGAVIMGYAVAEMIEMGTDVLPKLAHPNDLPRIADHFARLQTAVDGEVFEIEYQLRHADGSWHWLQSRDSVFKRDENGRVVQIIGAGTDVTEYKEVENALRQSQAELRHAIDTVPGGVLVLATDGSVRLTNPLAEQFLEILAPGWQNGRFTHLGKRPLAEILTSPPQGLWHEIPAEDRLFEALARPVEYSPDNTGWVLVVLDVTQERKIQQRAQRQERLAAIGQLAAGIAHDFNNIIAVITLYVQLLARMVEIPARAQEKLHTIEKQAGRATDLIQQILDFSRQSVLDRQPLDLLPFVKELVRLLSRTLSEDVQIEMSYDSEAYFIHADPSRIQQVIMNLAVNARDAMPQGGQLRIHLAKTRTEKATPLLMREMPPGEWVQIVVADSGYGIPARELSQIFEPFYTTKEVGKGTGLGLAQVYGIVQQHGGYIHVTTELAVGTTFCLYFPALASGEKVAVTLDALGLQPGQGQTILLVEDDLFTREALKESLVFMNYEVVEAVNGREALAVLQSGQQDIALVLSDAVMPVMGGIALFRACQQLELDIPVVLLTGHPLGSTMDELRALGLAGWLPKPPDLVSLGQLLTQVLAGR